MNRIGKMCWIALILASVMNTICLAAETPAQTAPNGIALPQHYRDWAVLAVSHRTDNHTLRVILGNEVAVRAVRENRIHPAWPDGAILAKLVWKETTHAEWPSAVVPDTFVHAEFMVKDATRYPATGGWGFARWLGKEQKPYGKDAGFERECFSCHLPVKDTDYVFSKPVALP